LKAGKWLLGDPSILAILLLGSALRLTNLTYHSLWFDEAISIRWARSSLTRIIEVGMALVEDRLPPLYYLLLKWWVDWAGLSEFSVRYLSVIFGVLLIPIIYVLGRRLGNRAVGLLAALLTALNPFLIWYSQEARMYSLAVLLGSAGVLCFVRALKANTALLPWLGLGLAALAGLYTHLYTGFLWPALALWLLLNPRIFKRVWLPFGATMGLVLLFFFPLARAIWRFSGQSPPGQPWSGLGQRALDLVQAFSLWQAPLSPPVALSVTVILTAFLLAGLLFASRRRTHWLFLLLALMPFLIANLLLLRSNLAFFGQRYFIVILPWLLLLQALGAIGIASAGTLTKGTSSVVRRGMIIVLILFTLIPLPGQWSPEAAKEAWRQTLAYMTVHVQAEDAVFIHPEWVRFPYQFYEARMKTPGQTYAAFSAVDETTDLDGPLNGILADHPVVWLIQSHIEQPDPDRRVENWFAARYPLATELYPPGITVKAYVPGYQGQNLPPEATPTDIVFEGGLRLRGFHLPVTRLSPQDRLFHPPSNWIHVTLYWSAGPDAADDLPYTHLIDEVGQVWGASLDRPTEALRLYPPSRWEANQVIRQDLDVNLNPAAPPGLYQLVVGVGGTKIFVAPVTLVADK